MVRRFGKAPNLRINKQTTKNETSEAAEGREVIPFYMRSNYQLFRYDPRYDSMPIKQPHNGETQNTATGHEKLLRRRDSKKVRFVTSNHNVENNRSQSVKGDIKQTLPSVCKNQTRNQQASLNLDESIRRWHIKSDTINSLPNITIPNHKVSTPHKNTGRDSHSSLQGSWSQLHLYNKTFNNIRTNPKHDPVKENILRRSVAARLKDGSTVAQLAKEPFFEDVLDICEASEHFPAYKKGKEISLDNFRALRNCKYLRVSDTNLRSLKEATLRSFSEG